MFLFCLVFAMFCARLFICALWSPAGKGLTSWLSFVVSSVSLSLSLGILGQVWYLIVSIPDLCTITYFYISQLIRLARASSYVTDFNTRNKFLTQKLLKQGYQYHKLPKTFSKFYR